MTIYVAFATESSPNLSRGCCDSFGEIRPEAAGEVLEFVFGTVSPISCITTSLNLSPSRFSVSSLSKSSSLNEMVVVPVHELNGVLRMFVPAVGMVGTSSLRDVDREQLGIV